MTKYRIYIDETGNSHLESSGKPNQRFLSLTGVIMQKLSEWEYSVITVLIDNKEGGIAGYGINKLP